MARGSTSFDPSHGAYGLHVIGASGRKGRSIPGRPFAHLTADQHMAISRHLRDAAEYVWRAVRTFDGIPRTIGIQDKLLRLLRLLRGGVTGDLVNLADAQTSADGMALYRETHESPGRSRLATESRYSQRPTAPVSFPCESCRSETQHDCSPPSRSGRT